MSQSTRVRRPDADAGARETLLAFDGVSVGYGRGEPVLHRVSFDLSRGEIGGLVAMDGRGKTTLVKCAAGLLPPSEGSVEYRGQDVYGMSFRDDQVFRRRCSVVHEGGALLANRTIFQNVALPIRYHEGGSEADAESVVQELLDRVGYNESTDALPWQVSARGRHLAAFARALVRKPELVLIDRIFEGLDGTDVKRLMEIILELNAVEGTSFLIVGQLAPTIFQVAERVLVLEGGAVLAHDFKQGLYRDERIKRAFETGQEEEAPPLPPEPVLPTDSSPFEPGSASDLQPVVIVPERREEPTKPQMKKTKKKKSSTITGTAKRPRSADKKKTKETATVPVPAVEASDIELEPEPPDVDGTIKLAPGSLSAPKNARDEETAKLAPSPIVPTERAIQDRIAHAMQSHAATPKHADDRGGGSDGEAVRGGARSPSSFSEGSDDGDGETTMTFPSTARDAIVEKARARHDARIDESARATESTEHAAKKQTKHDQPDKHRPEKES